MNFSKDLRQEVKSLAREYETVERRGASQVAQAERFFGKVTHTNGDHANQPFICCFISVHKTGAIEVCIPAESFCLKGKDLL
jgi:hypothetical protein